MPAAQNPCPKRVAFVREIIQETMGFAPFEKRAMEVLKVGKEKRAQRFCKKRLGTHQRGVKVRPPRPFPAPQHRPRFRHGSGPAPKSPQEKRLRLLNGGTLDMCGCCGAEEGVLVGGHEKDAEVGTIHLLLCPGPTPRAHRGRNAAQIGATFPGASGQAVGWSFALRWGKAARGLGRGRGVAQGAPG